MIQKTYVAVFDRPLDREIITGCVKSWMERFEGVEQLVPELGAESDCALVIKKEDDVMWHKFMQFRVLQGADFAWVYITLDRQAVETTGLPSGHISIGLDVLLELPNVVEIVDGGDVRRLDQLEAEGLL